MADNEFRIRLILMENASEELLRQFETHSEEPVLFRKKLYMRKGGFLVECADTPEARNMMETLSRPAEALPFRNSKEQFFRNLLERKNISLAGEQADLFLRERFENRNVLLFTVKGGFSCPLDEMFRNTAPMERKDILIPMRYDTVALVRNNQSGEGEDAPEYAMALIETLEEENGIQLVCGIGNCKTSWETLYESYDEAAEALETAEKSHLKGKVFSYREQFLIRLLSEIPPDEQKKIRARYLTPEIRRLLNHEMMETVQVFFQDDLNISTASRQLFIHRNTLLYRLEKIRKLTGLDLRQFSDATTFYILLNLQEEKSEN